MNDTHPTEWFTWRLRYRFVAEMRECGCPKKAAGLVGALATLEALYPRGAR